MRSRTLIMTTFFLTFFFLFYLGTSSQGLILHSQGVSLTRKHFVSSLKKVKNFFEDPAMGSVYYYKNMADNAYPIKENIVGEFFVNAVYYKHNSRALRQWFQKKATNMHLSLWWKKATRWFQEEKGEASGADIKRFIQEYDIDMTDYVEEDPTSYQDFNHFFFRKLKSGVRKIDLRQEVVVSPADSKVRVLPDISTTSKFFVKQMPFNLVAFLHDSVLAEQYAGGTLLTFRLAPTDYHRFHFPFDCTPSAPVFIKGAYEAVNPIAFRVGLWPISVNKRARITLHSPVFGEVIMMVVGASMVASLNFTYTPERLVKKGDETGFFAFGGSTICLLFKKKKILLPDVLLSRSENKQLTRVQGPSSYEKINAFESAVVVGQGVAMCSEVFNVNELSDPLYVNFLDKQNKRTVLELKSKETPFAWNTFTEGGKLIVF